MSIIVQDISTSLKDLHLPKKSAMPRLTAARYGKDNVRVYKVHRDQETGVQTVTEMTVCCLLEGKIDTS